jgi:hypothetical protein
VEKKEFNFITDEKKVTERERNLPFNISPPAVFVPFFSIKIGKWMINLKRQKKEKMKIHLRDEHHFQLEIGFLLIRQSARDLKFDNLDGDRNFLSTSIEYQFSSFMTL